MGVPAGIRIVAEAECEDGAPEPFAAGHALVFSQRAPGKSTPNEDAAALLPVDGDRGLLVVADGLGGQPGGESAARIAVECLARSLRDVGSDEGALRGAVLDACEAANRAVLELGIGAATTLAIGELAGGWLRPYHVGDSAILVVGQRGKLKLQTIAHSPVGYAVEAGWLEEEEALRHKERHLISNVVGAPDMRIEIGSPLRLADCDTVLLATDGLLDNLSVAEIVERVRAGSLPRVARRLAEQGRARMQRPESDGPSKPDDLTFVLFRLDRRRRAASGAATGA